MLLPAIPVVLFPILRTLDIKTSEFAAVLLTIIADAFFPLPPVILLPVVFCADAFIEIWPILRRVAKDAKKIDKITMPDSAVFCFFNIEACFSTRFIKRFGNYIQIFLKHYHKINFE